MSAVKSAFTSAVIASLVVLLAACESVTNLDVSYTDASAPGSSSPEASAGDAAAASEKGASVDAGGAGLTHVVLPGCPCDETAGLGCCIPAAGAPFCTGDTSACAEAKGLHVKCARPDPLTESACCWNGSVAALASTCASGASACTADSDCAGTGASKCSLVTCAGGTITIGTCGPTPPVCPQP